MNNYVREKMSVKLMSVNNKVLKNIGQFQCRFFRQLCNLRLVDNCLQMTAYDVIAGNESKEVILGK